MNKYKGPRNWAFFYYKKDRKFTVKLKQLIMSDKIIVKTDNRKNFTCTWPIVGTVHINEEGEFEAAEADARQLIELHPEFYLKSEGKEEISNTPFVAPLTDEKEPKIQDLTDELTDEEKKEQAEALLALTSTKTTSDELQKTELNELGPDEKDTIAAQTTTTEEDEEASNEAPLTEEEKALYIASLPDKTRKDLEELCKAFPGGEWRGKNKEDLVKYLTEKLG